MSARLPIARAILEGTECRFTKVDPNGDISGPDPRLQARTRDVLARSVYFDVQVGSDIYIWNPQKEYRLESSFGPLRLPYPDMWMEWQIHDEGGTVQMAAAVSERSGENVNAGEDPCNTDHFRIRFAMFMRVPDMGSTVNALRLWPYFDVDKEGKYVPGSRKTLMLDDGMSDEQRRIMRFQGEECIATAGLAMSLMNCKNVQTQESGRVNLRRSGSDKRRGIKAKALRYHTIILPGGGSQSDGAGGHHATAIHRVRGHFKTFTPERPLLGKHTGTYWWGWQVRGNKENGMVVSDYRVGA